MSSGLATSIIKHKLDNKLIGMDHTRAVAYSRTILFPGSNDYPPLSSSTPKLGRES